VSQENIELAKRFYPGTFDVAQLIEQPQLLAGFEALVEPDFEMVGEALGMEAYAIDAATPDDITRRTARGLDGFVDMWRTFLAAWQSWVITATEFVDVDDTRVLVLLDIRGRSKTHGVEIPIDSANVLTFRTGRLVRLELFTNRDAAYEAAGLVKPS
jgi:hypothetical protein